MHIKHVIFHSHTLDQKAEKREQIWLSPTTNSLTPTGNSKKQSDNTKPPQNYTTIADQLKESQLEWQQQHNWFG